jgi:hypothetical protein
MSLIMSVVSGAFVVGTLPARASENGLSHYPIGADTAYDAIMPQQGGTMYYQYDEYYSANQINNSQGKSALPGFNVDVTAFAPRILHTWSLNFAGFTLTSELILPFADI